MEFSRLSVGESFSKLRKNSVCTPEFYWSARLGQQDHMTQDAQKGDLLTRPTPARQDTPFPRQGRSERKGTAAFPVGGCPLSL